MGDLPFSSICRSLIYCDGGFAGVVAGFAGVVVAGLAGVVEAAGFLAAEGACGGGAETPDEAL